MKLLITFILFSSSLFSTDIQQFKRSHSIAYEMLEDARLKNSHVHTDWDFMLMLGWSYVQVPLARKTSNNNVFAGEIVKNLMALHLGGSVYLSKDIMVGAHAYYGKFKWNKDSYGSNSGGQTVTGFTEQSDGAFSDIYLDLKWRFLSRERYAMAVMPFIKIPTGGGEIPITIYNRTTGFVDRVENEKVLSDDSWGWGVRLVYEKYLDFMNLTFNLGYENEDNAKIDELDLRRKLTLGIGGYLPLGDAWGLNMEWMRHFTLPFNSNQNPNEFFLGASAGIGKRLVAFAGVGFGNLFSDNDGNDWRVSAGLKWAPRVWSDERKQIDLINQEVVVECKKPYIFKQSNKVTVRFPHDIGQIYDDRELVYVINSIKDRLDDIRVIDVIGHTSAPASEAYNQKLSEERANSVARVLFQNGIPEKLINPVGMGESQLLDLSGTSAAEEVNRRVEFVAHLKDKSGYYCEDLDDYDITPIDELRETKTIIKGDIPLKEKFEGDVELKETIIENKTDTRVEELIDGQPVKAEPEVLVE